jgi:hypothetical protein
VTIHDVHEADVLVVGGGLGGVAAALAATRRGSRVILTEATDWLGGQLTSQGTPPDEHRWVESFGVTRSYRELRERMRSRFLRTRDPSLAAIAAPALNPGGGWVSPLCVEPRLAAEAIDELVAPAVAEGSLTVLREFHPVAAAVVGDRALAVTVRHAELGDRTLSAPYILDATEEGDLLELAGVEHVTGVESRDATGEPSATAQAQPAAMQAITHVFAIEHLEGRSEIIDRPADYARWRSLVPAGWPGPLLGWAFPDPRTGRTVTLPFTPNPDAAADGDGAHLGDDPQDRDLWRYRRVVARRHTRAPIPSDVTVVNWPMNDYFEAPVTGVPADARQARLAAARGLSLSLLYWLQTEAPRPDGGAGWPGLRMRGDVMGTADGFAKAPYIREARRIRARLTIAEQDLAREVRGERGAVHYPDTVGIGYYRIDLHPSTAGDLYLDVDSCPFEIPLRALLPQRVSNLIAAGKAIGTTHITNGCYRVHPVEWNVGEAAGALASFCLRTGASQVAVVEDPSLLERFQAELMADGVDLRWPEDVR